MSLPVSQSIPCKDLVLRAHYFLLSSQTLSKVTLTKLLKLINLKFIKVGDMSGNQGIQS